MSSYIRAKRDNQTVFLYYEPTDTVKHIVEKLGKILNKSADDIRFVLNDVAVEDSKTCGGANFSSDGVLYYVFKEGNGWENVKIPQIEIEQ